MLIFKGKEDIIVNDCNKNFLNKFFEGELIGKLDL